MSKYFYFSIYIVEAVQTILQTLLWYTSKDLLVMISIEKVAKITV